MTSTAPDGASFSLPADFLTAPAPSNVSVQYIDFAQTKLLEYSSDYAVILSNVFTREECSLLLRGAEASCTGPSGPKWEKAMINGGNGRQMLTTDSRNCGRIIWDAPEIASKILTRVGQFVQEIDELKEMPNITGTGPSKRKETWRISRLNERMRFLKYEKDQYFRPHCDGSYVTGEGDEREISYFTLHLYLNESGSDSELEGGATTFHSMNMKERFDVEPKVGSVLIFQHRGLLHSGDDVVKGTKYTMRTDIMYKKVVKEEVKE